MEWPPQNTGLFAVAPCALCPVQDLFSLREYDSLDGLEPRGRYDIAFGQTEAEAIVAVETNGPAPWNVIAFGFGRFGAFCFGSFGTMGTTDFLDPIFDYQYTDAWEASDDTPLCYEYRRLRFKRELTGLSPSTSYDVSMDVERREMGGTWAAYATLTDTIVTDSTGRLTWEDDVPHARGYETWIAARTFVATPS